MEPQFRQRYPGAAKDRVETGKELRPPGRDFHLEAQVSGSFDVSPESCTSVFLRGIFYTACSGYHRTCNQNRYEIYIYTYISRSHRVFDLLHGAQATFERPWLITDSMSMSQSNFICVHLSHEFPPSRSHRF